MTFPPTPNVGSRSPGAAEIEAVKAKNRLMSKMTDLKFVFMILVLAY
jgi:hypothetical protein